jgi:hypothetical protein
MAVVVGAAARSPVTRQLSQLCDRPFVSATDRGRRTTLPATVSRYQEKSVASWAFVVRTTAVPGEEAVTLPVAERVIPSSV